MILLAKEIILLVVVLITAAVLGVTAFVWWLLK